MDNAKIIFLIIGLIIYSIIVFILGLNDMALHKKDFKPIQHQSNDDYSFVMDHIDDIVTPPLD